MLLIPNPTIVMLIEGAFKPLVDRSPSHFGGETRRVRRTLTDDTDSALESLREYGAAEIVSFRLGRVHSYGTDRWLILCFAYALPVADMNSEADPESRLNTYTIDGNARILWTAACRLKFSAVKLKTFPFPAVRSKQKAKVDHAR